MAAVWRKRCTVTRLCINDDVRAADLAVLVQHVLDAVNRGSTARGTRKEDVRRPPTGSRNQASRTPRVGRANGVQRSLRPLSMTRTCAPVQGRHPCG